MTAQQTSQQFGTTEPGNDTVYVEIALTATGTDAGDVISGYTAFTNGFAGTPLILGTNNYDMDDVGKVGAVGCRATSIGVTFYATASSVGSSALTDTFQVSALLRGALA